LTAAVTFTTRGLAVLERRQVLHALVEKGLLPIEPLSMVPSVELVKWRLPGASVLWGRFDQVRQRAEPAAADDLFFAINVVGTGLARQRGREATVNPGDAVVLRRAEGPFSVLRPTPSHLIGIRAPRHTLPLAAGRHDETPQLVPGQTPALRLLTGYLSALGAHPAPASPELADAVVGHLLELVALSLRPLRGDLPPAAGRAVRAARLAALKTDIARHLADPALSVAAVATRHGISVRYVHKLFEDDGRTYSQVVLGARLDHALRELRDPRCAERTVSAIAGAAGFGDLSYFNRTFRRRYGMTPSEARQPRLV
jgi:AraC-like DNA-binding protein